jgi:phosphoribosyl 1,2-cyclic phosphodiesterase
LKVLAARHDIPIYCNRFTREAIEAQTGLRLACRLFETGAAFSVGDVEVESFSVPHDAQDPVGFLVRTSSGNVGVLTDLGHVTRLALERMRPANVLLVEANHDVRLLQEDTRRPWATKQRILSRHGHLSNEAAAAMVESLAGENLKHVFLGHLSRDCNRPELAHAAVAQRLELLGARHIQLATASQDTPTPELIF